jgi:ABC-2 type transport system permease protein
MGSFFAAVTTGGDPSSQVAQIATFIPFSAPMVLPIRVAAGEVQLWEVLVSVAIVLASIVVAMRLAGRVYAGGAMHLRGQLKLRQALRAQETSPGGA